MYVHFLLYVCICGYEHGHLCVCESSLSCVECCLFSALQGQEMFTAEYLCCSLASQLRLTLFTQPQRELRLNKTSNRDSTLHLNPSSEIHVFAKVRTDWPKFGFWNFSLLIFNPILNHPQRFCMAATFWTSPLLALLLFLSLQKLCAFLCHGGLLESVSSRLWFGPRPL